MNIPPFLIGLSLLFWGVETERLLVAIVLALLAEGYTLVKWRYDFNFDDFIKISDLCSLLFLATVVLVFLNYEGTSFLRITTTWLPVVLAPLVIAQCYSTGNSVVIGTRLAKKKRKHALRPFDMRGIFIFVSVFAAACANSRSSFFLPGAAVLLLVILFVNRGRSFSRFFFVGLTACLLVASLFMSRSLDHAERYIVSQAMRRFFDYYRDKFADPFMAHVNFGAVGRQKRSSEIVLRLKGAAGAVPDRLKLGVYASYISGNWLGVAGFLFVPMETAATWKLYDFSASETREKIDAGHDDVSHDIGNRRSRHLELEYNLPREKGAIPSPSGSFLLTSKTLYELEQNKSGVLHVTDGAEIVSYVINYDPGLVREEDLPGSRYLQIPAEELPVLNELAPQFAAADADARVERIRAFFARGFSYSLQRVGRGSFATPLTNFLLHEKKGFCEYYATATALLLRRVGIPSRYVVGFSVQEKGFWPGTWIVRKRHAHAWVEAYFDGRWQTVDTTPPDWGEIDSQQATFFEPINDFFSYLRQAFKRYRIGSGEDYSLFYSLLVVVLTAFLVVRIYRRIRMERAASLDTDVSFKTFPSLVTPLTPVVDYLASARPLSDMNIAEYAHWARERCSWRHYDEGEFARLYRLHLKMRFDPVGLSEDELQYLDAKAAPYVTDIQQLQEED